MGRSLLKCRRSPAFFVAMLALFISLTGIGYAATGGGLILGRQNIASGGTALRSKGGPSLILTNTGGRPAASFNVLRGKPPFTVNSRGKVQGLNADLLDGLDSSAFQRRIAHSCSAGMAIRVVNANGSVSCVSVLSPSWGLSGNSGTNPNTDFLGTTDAQPLIFKTNNTEVARVEVDGNFGFGTATPGARIDSVAALGTAVNGTSQSATAISGTGASGDGVDGLSTSGFGVHGKSSTGVGVDGASTSLYGVEGVSQTVTGVAGASISGDGVHGQSTSNDGVGGVSTSGYGVVGATTSGIAGVLGQGANDGVLGTSTHPSSGGTAAAVDAINTGGGDIFIGQTSPGTRVARIDSTGKAFFDGGEQTGGADYAESMQASVSASTLAPGDVLMIDPQRGGEVRLSDRPDTQLVAGVYSTKPSVLATGNHSIDQSLAGTVPVAMLGIVPTKVSAENGAVKAGDLLTTARTPGYAMKSDSLVVGGMRIYPTGAILGKALQSLRGARGVIDVLVTLR
jgi:hypothetical protein